MGDFQKLEVWKEAHSLTIEIYRLTDELPKSELFGLTSQIRRAAVSVESNIAEGEGRFGKADRLKFFIDSRASIKEIQTQLLIIKDLYTQLSVRALNLFDRYEVLIKRMNSLINYRRKN
ncbi:MAG TPA: four helix bundle protein [Candidatus Saccharimonadales bacterium]|nr:four helix bundle protein [Candidatus Saccharimonadales bacterium]